MLFVSATSAEVSLDIPDPPNDSAGDPPVPTPRSVPKLMETAFPVEEKEEVRIVNKEIEEKAKKMFAVPHHDDAIFDSLEVGGNNGPRLTLDREDEWKNVDGDKMFLKDISDAKPSPIPESSGSSDEDNNLKRPQWEPQVLTMSETKVDEDEEYSDDIPDDWKAEALEAEPAIIRSCIPVEMEEPANAAQQPHTSTPRPSSSTTNLMSVIQEVEEEADSSSSSTEQQQQHRVIRRSIIDDRINDDDDTPKNLRPR